MKSRRDQILIVGLIVFGGSYLAWAQVTGADDRRLPYVGQLQLDGTPINGTADLSFTLHDAETGGGVLWGPEVHNAVPVAGGEFGVSLGAFDPIPNAVLRTEELFVSVNVNGTPLAGRQRILTGFAALRAGGLEMTDPTTGGRYRLTADEGGGLAGAGVSLIAVDDPLDGEPIFRVMSSGGNERFRVEHNGTTSTSNDLAVAGTTTLAELNAGATNIGTTTVSGDLTVTGTLSGRIVGGGEAACTQNGATFRQCRGAFGAFSCTGGGCGGACSSGTLRAVGSSNACYHPTGGWANSCSNFLCIE